MAAAAYNSSNGIPNPYETPSMLVPVELSRIIISEINEQQMIWLKEVDGERKFPIMIGIFEATSIDRRIKDIPRPRPLTHDLIVNTIQSLGAEMDSVVISSLKDHTYFASLKLKVGDGLVEVDARPSDAIAVAVTSNPPLRYMYEHFFRQTKFLQLVSNLYPEKRNFLSNQLNAVIHYERHLFQCVLVPASLLKHLLVSAPFYTSEKKGHILSSLFYYQRI